MTPAHRAAVKPRMVLRPITARVEGGGFGRFYLWECRSPDLARVAGVGFGLTQAEAYHWWLSALARGIKKRPLLTVRAASIYHGNTFVRVVVTAIIEGQP